MAADRSAAPSPRPARLLGDARVRVTVAATVIVAMVLVAVLAWAVMAQRRTLTDSVDNRVRQRAADLAALVQGGTITETLTGERDDDGLAQLVDADGDVVAASPNIAGEQPIAPPPGDDEQLRTVGDLPLDDADFRLLSRLVDTPDGRYALHVAGELDDVNESVSALTRNLALAAPAVLTAVSVIIWVVAGRALRRVEAANARQRRFVADASHELRSPLTSIRSELEVDLAHPEDADFAATERSVLEETIRLQRLVDDLLFLAREDAGFAPARTETVDLDEIVLREAEALRAVGTVAVDTRLVSGAQVTGNADELTRAVRNLLDNAGRHARSTVSITLGETDHRVELTVEDDGGGIPVAQADRIFERFARVDDARARQHGGAGLGLAITRDIVVGNRGSIFLDSEAGTGARFVMYLPPARR